MHAHTIHTHTRTRARPLIATYITAPHLNSCVVLWLTQRNIGVVVMVNHLDKWSRALHAVLRADVAGVMPMLQLPLSPTLQWQVQLGHGQAGIISKQGKQHVKIILMSCVPLAASCNMRAKCASPQKPSLGPTAQAVTPR
jgi:hypothetical protein